LKDNPADEDKLIQHYKDDYHVLTKLGKGPMGLKTSGNSSDRIEVLSATFLPEVSKDVKMTPVELEKIRIEREKARYVGRVTGRKTLI